MRKITLGHTVVFLSMVAIALALALLTTRLLVGKLALGDFRGIILFLVAIVVLYVYAIGIYRIFLLAMPLKPGEIAEGSREEFGYHVYLLFYLVLFYPIMRSGFMPVPLMRLVYMALGARLGENTYSSGIILDPPLVTIGSNTLIGQNALLVPHIIENRTLAHYPIRIGSGVTIGAHSVVLSGVDIGDDALVAVGAVVRKGTRIGAGEVWGGVPARRIKAGADSTMDNLSSNSPVE